MSGGDREDALGYLQELRQALAAPELEKFDSVPDEAAEDAAARLAVALGYCYVFGMDTDADFGILPAPEAIGAAQSLIREARKLVSDVVSLPGRWDEVAPGIEADSLCSDILERRMDLWVAPIALSDAALEAVCSDDPQAGLLNARIDALREAIGDVDEKILQGEPLMILSTLVGTELINNWRQLLVEPYASVPPYWLDGTLEEVDRACQQTLEQTLARFPKPTVAAERTRRAALVIRDLQPIVMAADTPAPSAPVILLRWRSPDGRCLAQVPYPRRLKPGQKVKLTIRRAETSEPADEWAGAAVDCEGSTGRLGRDARMDISLDDLHAAAQSAVKLPLRVNVVLWEELPPI
ncbi:MAG: hypothetical protein GYA33_14065 [Thermogutta sp.]|nr:hypothetical protein [Thermogutta sp.]